MHRPLLILVFLMLSCFHQGFSQRMKTVEAPDSLAIRVMEVMKEGRSERFSLAGHQFDSLWNGGSLSDSQKRRIFVLYNKMNEKQWRAKPFLYEVTATLTAGRQEAGLSVVQYDGLLDQLENGLEALSSRDFVKMTQALHTFLKYKQLNRSNFFNLQASEGAIFALKYENTTFYDPTQESSEDSSVPAEESSEEDWGSWGDNAEESQNTNDDWSSWDWGEDDSTDQKNEDTALNWDDDNWSGATGGNVIVEEKNSQTLEEMVDSFIQDEAPAIEGPYIHFDQLELKFETPFDTLVLSGIQGDFLLVEGIFVAYSGKADWKIAGFTEGSPYCTFEKFFFSTKQPKFEVNKATMFYPEKLTEPTLGYFEYKSSRVGKNAKPTYPRFTSYGSNVRLASFINDNFEYLGGYSLWGVNASSNSIFEGESKVHFSRGDDREFLVRSGIIEYTDSTFVAPNGKIVVKYGRDSLFHPDMKITYRQQDSTIHALKNRGNNELSSFRITYYDMDVKADYLRWNVAHDSLDISIFQARDHRPAFFESKDYFNKKNYKSLSDPYGFHPLNSLTNYSNKVRSKTFSLLDFVEYYKLDYTKAQHAMFKMRENNFIEFDAISNIITVKDKAYHYTASYRRQKDYDDLTIPSRTNAAPNATLHLNDSRMTVRGIDKFYLSEKLDVYIIPEQESIDLIGKRDFKFDGKLFSGNFEFVGHDFVFRYDSFLIQLDQIDSIRFYLPDSANGQRKKVDNSLVSADEQLTSSLNSNMGATNGTLYINRPDNKSGRKVFPNYPRFDAERGAVVYFDNPTYLDQAYDKSVYFIIPPFSIDSLAGGDPSAIGFQGRFVSGGIFPDFEEKMTIMPDNSLGFVHTVPEEGYTLYDTDGIIYDEIRLDKNGLQGEGRFELLASQSESEKYTMYQDSMVAFANSSMIEAGDFAGISYPSMSAEDLELLWLPHEDSLFLKTTDKPIMLYNEGDMVGAAVLTHEGLRGKGDLEIRGSQTHSEQLTFEEFRWQAREAQFNILSEDSTKSTLYGDYVEVDFDLENNLASISPEIEGDAAISFPYAMTKTSITEAEWKLEEDIIIMTKPEEVDISDSYFYSTRPDMDSLVFSAEGATYDIQAQEMSVTGIPHIVVADAMITPDSNRIKILPNFVLPRLTNATLVIDTLNGYHNLFDGNIDILSRKMFEGDATYRFVNAVQDTFNIKLDEFELKPDRKKQLHTESSGQIVEADELIISPGMYFKGTAKMRATSKPLELDGFVKLDLKNIPYYDTWIVYQSNDEEQQEIIFDFASAITENGELLTAGIHFEEGTNVLYSTFVFQKRGGGDEDFFVPNGLLSYDEEKAHYIVEDTMKTRANSFAGKVYTFNEETTDIVFEGGVNLFMNPYPKVNKFMMRASAIGSGNLNNNTVRFNGFTTIETDLPGGALTSMGNNLNIAAEDGGYPKANEDLTKLFYKVGEIIGDKATKDYEALLSADYAPLVKMSRRLQRGIVLSDFDMEWSEEQTAWYSTGKIGVSSILSLDVNAKMEGYLEVSKTAEGDVMSLFINGGPDAWYYLNYNLPENRLIVYSGDPVFNSQVAKKSNVAKAKLGEFILAVGEKQEVLDYVNRFRLLYMDIDEEYQIAEPTLSEDSGDPFFDAGSLEENEDTENIIFDDESLYDESVADDEDSLYGDDSEENTATVDDGFGEETEEAVSEDEQVEVEPVKEKKKKKKKGKKKKEEVVEEKQEEEIEDEPLYEDDGF